MKTKIARTEVEANLKVHLRDKVYIWGESDIFHSRILISLKMSVLVRIIARWWGKKGRHERETLYVTFREDKTI